MATGTSLRARKDADLPERLARSAAATGAGAHLSTGEALRWLAERRSAQVFRVEKIPFTGLDQWHFAPGSGNLTHRSGRFFTVEGLRVTRRDPGAAGWEQPIIVQPEIGILGILAKEFDGVLHFLMQAKAEPGNPNGVQLSPTVQATRSNYTGVHRGAPVPYLEHFTRAAGTRTRILTDTLQSEHGSWFFRKSNRNMIAETHGEVAHGEDFRWLTLGQIGELLRLDNVVNMDSRTVLACAPVPESEPSAARSDTDLLSWFTGERSRHEVRAELIPLDRVSGWRRGIRSIEHEHRRYFRVAAVSVEAGSREVRSWTQPLVEPLGRQVAAFVVRRMHDVPHLLVHARVEGGFLDTVELGPTVQTTPDHHLGLPRRSLPPFLTVVRDAPPERIRYRAVHAEEGGRFWRAEARYLFVEATEEEAPTVPPPGYAWVTPGQLGSLVRHGHYLNVQARTLLAVLKTGAVAL